MSELILGSSVPLFDRLASGDGQAEAGAFFLTPSQLEASIARELARLCNTRSRLGLSESEASTGTVIDYGIPDFSALSPRRGEDRDALEAALLQAITQFEARLSNVRVTVEPVADRGDVAAVVVSGDVTNGMTAQRLSFALDLNPTKSAA